MKKKIAFFIVLIILFIIQFLHPAKNRSNEISAADITKVTDLPQDVLLALRTACYDCHSNNTEYPWYNNIQPVAWWLNHHVEEGKHRLNFSTFGSYSTEKAKKKLLEIAEVIEENEMPLSSYTLIHKDAILDTAQKQMIINWAKNAAVSYTVH